MSSAGWPAAAAAAGCGTDAGAVRMARTIPWAAQGRPRHVRWIHERALEPALDAALGAAAFDDGVKGAAFASSTGGIFATATHAAAAYAAGRE